LATILTIGAHDAGLARAQAESVATRLRDSHQGLGIHLELVNLRAGHTPLHDDHIAENRSAIRTLHELLLASRVDLVVHRAFDLRGQVPDGLCLAAVPPRRSPYDAMVTVDGRTFDDLESGERIGVVQLRARAQLIDHRPDLRYELLSGDVSSWLMALLEERIEALIAPNSAVEELGLQDRVTELFPPEMLVPAPGSGLLLCLCREADGATRSLLEQIHDLSAESEYKAEIAFVRALGSAWEAPIGALAQRTPRGLNLIGLVASPDGMDLLRQGLRAESGPADQLGDALAEAMLESGARQLLHGDDEAIATEIPGALLANEADWENLD
jgi:hydroxymethylbilane synthase